MSITEKDNKLLVEETKNEISNIRQRIADLRLIEDIYLLAKFSQDAKNMLYRSTTDEIKICVYFYEKNILKKFVNKYIYTDMDGKKYPSEDSLYIQLRSSNGDFRTDDYLKEYTQVVSILEKKMGNGDCLILRRDTTPEDFLNQLDPDYAIKYAHYELNKNLSINDSQQKPKFKL
jgi:hypothetical protein